MPVIENWEVERLTLQAVNGNCTWKAVWPQVFCNSSSTTSSPGTLSWVVCLFAYFVFRSKNIKWKRVPKRNWKEELHLKLAGSPEFPLLIYVGTDSLASLCAGKTLDGRSDLSWFTKWLCEMKQISSLLRIFVAFWGKKRVSNAVCFPFQYFCGSLTPEIARTVVGEPVWPLVSHSALCRNCTLPEFTHLLSPSLLFRMLPFSYKSSNRF